MFQCQITYVRNFHFDTVSYTLLSKVRRYRISAGMLPEMNLLKSLLVFLRIDVSLFSIIIVSNCCHAKKGHNKLEFDL